MKRWRWHLLLFAVVYLVTLVATLPAALALRWGEPLLAKLPQRPQLLGVSGSLWTGQALQVNYGAVSLGELHWQLSPWRVVLGSVAAELQLYRPEGQLDAELISGFNGRQLVLHNVTGQLPASLMKGVIPKLPLSPVGSFALNMKEAALEGGQLRSLDGRIVWNKGGISSPLALEFGDLVAEFSSSERGIAGQIKDSGGPMQLEAQLQLTADGSYTLSGKSSARASASPALKTSLSLLGQPNPQGTIPFRFSGRL